MTQHASSAVLSAYLDDELKAKELEQVEQHLEECPPCREQLIGLRSVVTALRGLERQAPSPVLAQTVVRRVAIYGQPRGLMERLEGRLEKIRLDGSPFVIFALVLAFAVMIVALSQSVERSGGTTRLVVLPSVQPEVEKVVLGERVFERVQEVWIASGSHREGARVVSSKSTEGQSLLAEIEGLDELLAELPVVFELATGETIELRPAADQPP